MDQIATVVVGAAFSLLTLLGAMMGLYMVQRAGRDLADSDILLGLGGLCAAALVLMLSALTAMAALQAFTSLP